MIITNFEILFQWTKFKSQVRGKNDSDSFKKVVRKSKGIELELEID